MAENSNNPKNVNSNKQGELKTHARSSSPSFDPRANKNRQMPNANLKKQVKKKILTEGIKKGAQAYGVPEAATEQILKTEMARDVIDSVADSSSVTGGIDKVVRVITVKTFMKYIPLMAAPFLFLLLAFLIIFSKDSFSGLGDGTDVYEELRDKISEVSRQYYSKARIDGNLILATLVAYNDNEEIDEEGIDAKNMAYMKEQVRTLAEYQIMTTTVCDYDSTTLRLIAGNDDIFGEANYNCVVDMEGQTYSISIDEGQLDDDNSGSVYYWNLIDHNFIFEYYNDYMINKDDPNSAENDEKIEEIIREIYEYYEMMDKLSYGSYATVCSNGITVDGVTMDLEQYVKGVLNAELGYLETPLETLKALAVAARSYALATTNNCTREISNSTNHQTYEEYIFGIHNLNIEEAVTETAGKFLSYNGEFFLSEYSTIPRLNNSSCDVTCDATSCYAQLYYSNRYSSLGSHTIEIPRGYGFPTSDVYDYATGLSQGIYGHCRGMSQIGAWYDGDDVNGNGKTYEEILEKYYSSDVEISNGSGEGLVDNGDGYLQRVSRATRSNPFYYEQDENNHGVAGTLEGECAWYATGRAKEILSTLNIGQTWTYNGNGGTYCDASNYDKNKFEISRNYNEPKAGAIVSWKSGLYGHVAVVESVDGDYVTISEAGLGWGPTEMYGCSSGECARRYINNNEDRKEYCEHDGSGCFAITTLNISRMRSYSGAFQCYIYLTEPK